MDTHMCLYVWHVQLGVWVYGCRGVCIMKCTFWLPLQNEAKLSFGDKQL